MTLTVNVHIRARCDSCGTEAERSLVDGSPARLLAAVRRSLVRREAWQLAKTSRLRRLLRLKPKGRDLCPLCQGEAPKRLLPGGAEAATLRPEQALPPVLAEVTLTLPRQ